MGHDPFRVGLGELRDHRSARHVVRQAPLLGPLVADLDSGIPAGAVAELDVVLETFEGGLSARGSARADWEGECRRCLRKVAGKVDAPVKELFRRGGGPEDGTYPLGEDHVDLREMVLDCLFSALPVLPLCREDCKGICTTCGADLNTSSCECSSTAGDNRWTALDVLRADDGGKTSV